ncbi:MAG: aspartate/glutamate racemase family protein [Spirochaetia bacterium]
MAVRIYCIHTITGLVETFNSLIGDTVPGDVLVHHISDESLIRRILSNGEITKDVRKRFFDNVTAAEQAGADIVQVTCSSVTPAIACARELVDIPIFSIDEPMARKAVSEFDKIGVMATNPGTLYPSSQLLESTAETLHRKVEVRPVLCEGAYDALLVGNKERHDRIVLDYFREITKEVDAVVLAQASMARIINPPDEGKRAEERAYRRPHTPVLTSPGPAVESLAEFIRSSAEYSAKAGLAKEREKEGDS